MKKLKIFLITLIIVLILVLSGFTIKFYIEGKIPRFISKVIAINYMNHTCSEEFYYDDIIYSRGDDSFMVRFYTANNTEVYVLLNSKWFPTHIIRDTRTVDHSAYKY